MTEHPAPPSFVGLLCDIGRGAYLRREVFVEMLRLCGQEGITHVLPYLEDMIRLPAQERACPACAYDATDWRDFERAAAASGVELVPHVNVIGHTERILPHYPELLSTAGEHEMDVTLPAAQAWTGRCLDEFCAIAQGRHILVGGDEWQAPRRLLDARAPLGEVWAAQINRAAAVALRHGRTPIVWHDMLLHYPQAYESLTREVVIALWFYDEEADFPALADLKAAGFRTIMASGTIGGVLSRRRQRAVRSALAGAARHRADGFLLTCWETNRWEMQKLAITLYGRLLRGEDVPSAVSEALSLHECLARLPAEHPVAQDWRRRLAAQLADAAWQAYPETLEYLQAELAGDLERNRASYLRYHHPDGPLFKALKAPERAASVAMAALPAGLVGFGLEATEDPDLGPVLRLANGAESFLVYPRFGGSLQGWRLGTTALIPNPLPGVVRRHRPRPGGYRSFTGVGGLRPIWGLGCHQNPCITWQEAYAWEVLEDGSGRLRLGMRCAFPHADLRLEIGIVRGRPGFSLTATAVNRLARVHAGFNFNLPLALPPADLGATRLAWQEGGAARSRDLVSAGEACFMVAAPAGITVETPGYACSIASDPGQTAGYFIDWGAGWLTPDAHSRFRQVRAGEEVAARWELAARTA